jgi:hypothetical protein
MQAPDRAPRRVVMALAGLLALAACAMAAMLWLLHPSAAHDAREADLSQAAAPPRLQTAPQPDLDSYRAQKRAELDATGPASDAPGFARIPVERAMALMTERGLRADAQPPDTAP